MSFTFVNGYTMKLKDDFFQILTTTIADDGLSSIVRLNSDHIIYQGHFPGHPITPGVIQLQIIHELLEEHLGIKIKLMNISNCKFLNVLDPVIDSSFELDCRLQKSGDLIAIKAIGKSGSNTIIKLESVYAFS